MFFTPLIVALVLVVVAVAAFAVVDVFLANIFNCFRVYLARLLVLRAYYDLEAVRS